MPSTNVSQTRDVRAQAQVVAFVWKKDDFDDSVKWADLADSTPLDISAEVHKLSIDKGMSNAAGTFSIILPATRDWIAAGIAPKTWVLIYLSNEGDLNAMPTASAGGGNHAIRMEDLAKQGKNLRCIGFIERVGVVNETQANGVNEVFYEISGRDFGVIYERTDLYLNLFYWDKGVLDAASASFRARDNIDELSVSHLISTLHSLYFTPQDFPNILNLDPKGQGRKTLATMGFQFLLPQQMISALGLKLKRGKSLPFWGNLDEITWFWPSFASFPVENVMTILGGNAWQKLKAYSLEPLHLLFTEIEADGKPSITLRPIPWALDARGYPTAAQFIDSMLDVFYEGNSLTIPALDILESNLGPDVHNLYNFFQTTTPHADYKPQDNISELQSPSKANRIFPYSMVNSIARSGFSPMLVELNTMAQLGLNVDGLTDAGGLLELNEVIMDYWRPSRVFESGTITIIGRPGIKCGGVLKLGDDVSYHGGNLYFIEGRQDEFEVSENGTPVWTTTVTVTRGAPASLYQQAGQPGQDPLKVFTSKREKFLKRASYTPKNR